MRVLVTTVQVPFVSGGAEVLAEDLLSALRAAGHAAELVAIPFKWYPCERVLDHILACRLLDLTESVGLSVDRLIGLKFPAYLVPHPNKVLWMLHQHRTAYDLWDPEFSEILHDPVGLEVRDIIHEADRRFIPEARSVYTISDNVTYRLQRDSGIESSPLYPPPRNGDRFYCAEPKDYFFCPGRLSRIKRQELVLEALAKTRNPVRVRFCGTADYPPYADELKRKAAELEGRIEWLGHQSDEALRDLYAHCLGVIFPPLDEDYGYVTLEAMLASKPVITCRDSGGPLSFVVDRQTGAVVEPDPATLAAALDELWEDRRRAQEWGKAGRDHYQTLGIGWPNVLNRLLS